MITALTNREAIRSHTSAHILGTLYPDCATRFAALLLVSLSTTAKYKYLKNALSLEQARLTIAVHGVMIMVCHI